MRMILSVLLAFTLMAVPAQLYAQVKNSAPIAEPIVDIVPIADPAKVFPAPMKLIIDATDVTQAIFRVKQIIPVANDEKMVLLYPKWLPGNHAPRGEIEKLAGLKISANGKPVTWRRDSLDVFAFHVDVPAGAKQLDIEFEFLSATNGNQGRVVVAPKMMNVRWHQLSLYPAGYYARNIPVDVTITYPKGWKAGTSLRPARGAGDTVTYKTVDYDTLVDSPAFAGAHFKKYALSDRSTLNVVADSAEYLAATEPQIEHHRRLVREARNLFGSEQYDHYDFLLALTEEMGGIGIEHHRSSENGVNREYFTEWDKGPGRRSLLPHEIVHSWNGKYRRPKGIYAPDFKTPSRDDLLWVYEGQTQFWGYVLGARSGLYSKADTLDAIASIAAGLDQRVGRAWRPLADTAHDPIISARKPKAWSTWQRQEDYYNEGMLIWLEADQIIRRETGGQKSLEDFAKAFFGGRDGDWGVVTYDLDEVIATLNAVHPYDWKGFLQERVFETTKEAPKNGITLGGYELIYTETPSAFIKAGETRRNYVGFSHSIGLWVRKSGVVSGVAWQSPAFKAGLTTGYEIAAVGEEKFSIDALRKAIAASKTTAKPITLILKKGDRFRTVNINYNGGNRYPRLRKIGESEGGLDTLLKPQVTGTVQHRSELSG